MGKIKEFPDAPINPIDDGIVVPVVVDAADSEAVLAAETAQPKAEEA